MNNLPPFPGNTPQGDPQVPSYLTQQRQRNKSQEGMARIFQLWYRITSPPEPDASAPFEERELFRRGRTGSQITIVLFILLFISYPAAFAGSNSFLIAILTIDLFILTLAMALNRLRMVSIAGILVVLIFTASPTVNILTTPGGVNTSALPIFGLLVLPLMCAVSFLPPWWVFVVAAGNCLFTLFVLNFMPSSGELHEVLKVAFPGVVTPILLSQGIVSIVAFLWVRSANEAIVRADRAEEIAALEQQKLELQERELEQKHQLDFGIQQILKTHVRIANGDFTVRAPLAQDNVLWQIAYSLNNLLARLQGYSRMIGELQHLRKEQAGLYMALQNDAQVLDELRRTKEAANRLVEALRKARSGHADYRLPLHSGTVIDSVVRELGGTTPAAPSEQRPLKR